MTAGLKPCYLAGSVHFITFSCYRAQAFTYDFFGNINKSGSVSFSSQGGNGNHVPGLTYDGAGNVMTDNQGNTFMYDPEMRPVSINGNWITYDAFNRAVEIQTGSNSYEQVLYSPTGQKIAVMNGSAVVSYTLPLPAGVQAVYNSSGLWYYRFADWLGSSRLALDTGGNLYVSRAYAPFGETYAGAGTGTNERLFTSQTQDVIAGPQGIYDFLFRQQSSSQGRWLVPDPAGLAAVDLSNPQTWNRYAYVANNPLNTVDPLGLQGHCAGPHKDGDCDWVAPFRHWGGSDGFVMVGQTWHDQCCLEFVESPSDPGAIKWIEDAPGYYTTSYEFISGVSDFMSYYYSYANAVRNARIAASTAAPTSSQYIQAIHDSFATFPSVCGIGGAVYLGGGRIGVGMSADTQNGVRFASGFNFINAAGYKVNYTISGGANGNISYAIPTPLGAGPEVGTQNGSLTSIQSISLSTNGPGWKNAALYANISNMGDPNCK